MNKYQGFDTRCGCATVESWDPCQLPAGHTGKCRTVSAWTRFVCWFSARWFDIHDYTRSRGGDGYPLHFYTYTCWNCGKKFEI